MSRLTKDTREQMARKLVAHRYKDEAEALAALNRTLADRVHAHIYTPEVLAAMETVEKEFPSSFERSDYGFTVNAGGFSIMLGAPMRSRWVTFPRSEGLNTYRVVGRYARHNITDETLVEEVKAYAERLKKIESDWPEAYHEALAVLNTITTGKKLAEAWPEAMPVIGDLVPEECRTLPAVKVADINEKFGLPPQESETTDAN